MTKRNFLVLVILFLFNVPLSATPAPAGEIRAVWVKLEELTSREKIDQLVDSARAANINLIFAQVRRLGVVLYPSEIEKTSPLVPENLDPLDYLLGRALQQKIEVHAWVNMFYVWNQNLPLPADNCARNPGWPMAASSGMIFLNPGKTEVQDHLLNLLTELAVNYPLDGIHLDYIRYPHDVSDGYQDFISQNKNQPQTREYWADYRRRELTGYVRRISETLNRINPQIKLSVAVLPEIREATYYKGQDWPQWLADGLIDFAVPMCYSTDWTTIKDQMSQAARSAGERFVVAGLGSWRVSLAETASQIKNLRLLASEKKFPALKGFALFSYDSLKKQPNFVDSLKKSVLSFFAEMPVMPWKKQKLSAERAAPRGLLVNRQLSDGITPAPNFAF